VWVCRFYFGSAPGDGVPSSDEDLSAGPSSPPSSLSLRFDSNHDSFEFSLPSPRETAFLSRYVK